MAGCSAFHLSARPKPPWTCLLSGCTGGRTPSALESSELPYTPGETAKLGLAEWSERDGLVYVPESYSPCDPSPVVLALHSDTSTAHEALSSLLPFAEEHRLILAAPESRGAKWDRDCELFNEDVAFINRALEVMFEHYCVKPEKVGVAGFSGGASFALDLGVPNGPVFSHIMAFGLPEMEGPCYEDGPEIFLSYPRDAAQVCAVCTPGKPCYSYSCSPRKSSGSGNSRSAGDSADVSTGKSSKASSEASGVTTAGTTAAGSTEDGRGSTGSTKGSAGKQGLLPRESPHPHRLLSRLRSWGPRCTVLPFSGGDGKEEPGFGEGRSGSPRTRTRVGHSGVRHGTGTGVGYTSGSPEESGGGLSVQEMFPREVVASAVDWFAKGKGSCPGFSYNNYEFWEKPGRAAIHQRQDVGE